MQKFRALWVKMQWHVDTQLFRQVMKKIVQKNCLKDILKKSEK